MTTETKVPIPFSEYDFGWNDEILRELIYRRINETERLKQFVESNLDNTTHPTIQSGIQGAIGLLSEYKVLLDSQEKRNHIIQDLFEMYNELKEASIIGMSNDNVVKTVFDKRKENLDGLLYHIMYECPWGHKAIDLYIPNLWETP